MTGSPRVSLDDFDLITLDSRRVDEETWLYIPEPRTKAAVECSYDLKLSAVSQRASVTTHLQQYVENHTVESGDSPGRKIIDTRTFTRPRKNRSTDANMMVCNETAILQAAEINFNEAYVPAAVRSPAFQQPVQFALNQTFDQEPQPDARDILNGTYGVEGSPVDDDVITNNNNIALNATFTTNGVVPAQGTGQDLMNATFNLEQHAESSPDTESRVCDEFQFKKPLLTQNRKIALTRTSTIKEDELPNHLSPLRPLRNGSLSSTPMAKNRTTEMYRVNDVMVSPISGVSHDQRYYSNESLPDEQTGPVEGGTGSSNMPKIPNFSEKSPTDDLRCPAESVTNSACSSMGSRYSSQSLESDSASVPCREEVVHRSMPDLKSSQRATNLPNPALDGRSLNRLHGSETGLRPPSGSGIPGAKPRTQLRLPQARPAEPVAPVPAAEAQRVAPRSIPAPVASSLAAPAPSGLRMPGIRKPMFSARPSSILNSTVTVETATSLQPAADASAIPRPRMSKIPAPRAIPAPTVSVAKPRFIRPPGISK